MKLLTCIKCNEVFNLGYEIKECAGKHIGGVYVDELNAKIWGKKETLVVVGFANSSFSSAVNQQRMHGDLPPTGTYGGQRGVSMGRDFTAFIIPDSASSIDWTEEKPGNF